MTVSGNDPDFVDSGITVEYFEVGIVFVSGINGTPPEIFRA